MRELKFRAYLKKEKKYVFPTMILVDFGIVTGIAYIDIDEITHQPIERRLIIEDVVLEQATGIKDKNRKMIYEGDILSIPRRKDKKKDKLYTVVWHKTHARLNFANTNGEFGEISIGKIMRSQIVGNIHENSELLENKK